jgi:hypothetical protein
MAPAPPAAQVAWVVAELTKRNLTKTVAQLFFHDDEIGDSQARLHGRSHHPHTALYTSVVILHTSCAGRC